MACRNPSVRALQRFRERVAARIAMILGMNPKVLRESMRWNLFLWPKRHHWALVAQPVATFDARIVDDFAYSAQHCFNSEVPSAQFFLVLELLVEGGNFFPMLSVKPDFVAGMGHVQRLGSVGPLNLLDIEAVTMQVIARYKNYSDATANTSPQTSPTPWPAKATLA
ncbi:unnamed protein product [Effrenium voratum]|nr:unnamed protein product [Effrenium voratum]